MSATSVGRRVVVEAGAAPETTGGTKPLAPAGQNQGSPEATRKDAMAAILAAIPSEGLATYLAIYALVLTVFLDDRDQPLAWAAFGAAAVGAGINIFALLWAAGVEWKKNKPEKAAPVVVSLAWRVVVFMLTPTENGAISAN